MNSAKTALLADANTRADGGSYVHLADATTAQICVPFKVAAPANAKSVAVQAATESSALHNDDSFTEDGTNGSAVTGVNIWTIVAEATLTGTAQNFTAMADPTVSAHKVVQYVITWTLNDDSTVTQIVTVDKGPVA